MPRTIPEIRARLHELADGLVEAGVAHHTARELHELAEETRRRPAVRRTPRKLGALTEGLREAIRECAARNPAMSQQEIAVLFRLNSGRVSEALAGTRGERVTPG